MAAPLTTVGPISVPDQEHALKQTDSKQSVHFQEFAEGSQATSIFSELSRKQTARKYWKVCNFPPCSRRCLGTDKLQAALFCMISGLAACMDGFQTKIPGSIIANRGFINQFGRSSDPLAAVTAMLTPLGTQTDAAGLSKLDPLHIAAWGGIYQGGVRASPSSLSFEC